VAALLLGGIAALPWWVGLLLDRIAPRVQHRALWMLPIERARRVRASAAIAVSGVVAALSLAVALTVMVASFRVSVLQWLDARCCPACAVRCAAAGSSRSHARQRLVGPGICCCRWRRLPGVERLSSQRVVRADRWHATKPVGDLAGAAPGANPARVPCGLPWLAHAVPAPPGDDWRCM